MKKDLLQMVEDIQSQLEVVKQDATKFVEKGNAAAGTRVRTGSMNIIKALKEVRITVQELKGQ